MAGAPMKKNKKLASLIFIIIGVVLFIITILNPQKPVTIPLENKSKTSGWKLYRNDEYHFSFKYPEGLLSNFKVDTTEPITVTLKQLESIKKSKSSLEPNSYNVFFEANGWKSDRTLDEFIKENLEQTKISKSQTIKLKNTLGLRITNIDTKADAYFYYNLFKHGNYIYNFAIFADNPDEIRGNTSLLNEIISTVEFY